MELPNVADDPIDLGRYELAARLVHISDSQICDEESPARLPQAHGFVDGAWRPNEAYSTQLLDGMIRTINKLHVALHPVDFVVFTGDATDNCQANELNWFLTAFDGGVIDPLSGVDDRDPADRPDPRLDPHHSFAAQGLYRRGVHGDAPTVPWYTVVGNHDHFAIGVFPVVTDPGGRRISPMPGDRGIPLLLPAVLDPVSSLSWALITPADLGPPPRLSLPTRIDPNVDRRYLLTDEIVTAHFETVSEPRGHGFADAPAEASWYSAVPHPGVRLIALDSATPTRELPGIVYSEGAISRPQVAFLEGALQAATQRGEMVIVATHHPSDALQPRFRSALTPASFRQLLNAYPCVKLHLAGHWHRHAVFDRGGYMEIVTGSIIDPPQEGRVIEIWREIPTPSPSQGEGPGEGEVAATAIQLRYRTFSHLDEIADPDGTHATLFDDPLRAIREVAAELAGSE